MAKRWAVLRFCREVYGPPREVAGDDDEDDDDEPKVEDWMKALRFKCL